MKQETKHTPGPWFVNNYRATIQTRSPALPTRGENKIIAYTATSNPIMPITSEADGNLIAAAPELLHCLRRFINELPSKRDWLDPELEALSKQAIDKAEGRK